MSESQAEAKAEFEAMKAAVSNLDDDGLRLLFTEGRTLYGWTDKKVPEALLRRVVELAQIPPVSANILPARFVFVVSDAAKEKLKPCLSSGNVDKTMAAPATVIVAHDPQFWRHMDRTFPHGGMKQMFEEDQAAADVAAFRNGTLTGGYMIMAARALGLDCGPMSGFDNGKVDEVFFADSGYKSNFLCNLGYGDTSTIKPRGYKFSFDEVARID